MLCCLVYCGYSSVNTVILTPTLLVPTGTVKLIFVITSWPSPFEVALKVALAPSAARVAERADGVISVVPISRGGGGVPSCVTEPDTYDNGVPAPARCAASLALLVLVSNMFGGTTSVTLACVVFLKIAILPLTIYGFRRAFPGRK